MKFMVQDIVGLPWASPLEGLGRLELSTGSGCGNGGGDTIASWAAGANDHSLCRHFAWLLCLRAGTGAHKLLRNSVIIG